MAHGRVDLVAAHLGDPAVAAQAAAEVVHEPKARKRRDVVALKGIARGSPDYATPRRLLASSSPQDAVRRRGADVRTGAPCRRDLFESGAETAAEAAGDAATDVGVDAAVGVDVLDPGAALAPPVDAAVSGGGTPFVFDNHPISATLRSAGFSGQV